MNEVSAKNNKVGKQVTCNVDLGDNLQDAVAKFGEQVVFTNFCQNATVTAQGAIRRMIDQGYDDATIATRMDSWKPGVQMARVVDPKLAVQQAYSRMSENERLAFIAYLQSQVS